MLGEGDSPDAGDSGDTGEGGSWAPSDEPSGRRLRESTRSRFFRTGDDGGAKRSDELGGDGGGPPPAWLGMAWVCRWGKGAGRGEARRRDARRDGRSTRRAHLSCSQTAALENKGGAEPRRPGCWWEGGARQCQGARRGRNVGVGPPSPLCRPAARLC